MDGDIGRCAHFGKLRKTAVDATMRGHPLGDHVRELPIVQRLPHDHHDVSRGPGTPNGPKGLTHHTLGPVPNRRVADAPRRRDTEPWPPLGADRPRRPLQHEHEAGRDDTLPGILYAQKLAAFADPIPSLIPTRRPTLCVTQRPSIGAGIGPGIGHRYYFLVPAVTARRQRPRWRRFFRTARPPRVERRLRKPCVRSRLVLWG